TAVRLRRDRRWARQVLEDVDDAAGVHLVDLVDPLSGRLSAWLGRLGFVVAACPSQSLQVPGPDLPAWPGQQPHQRVTAGRVRQYLQGRDDVGDLRSAEQPTQLGDLHRQTHRTQRSVEIGDLSPRPYQHSDGRARTCAVPHLTGAACDIRYLVEIGRAHV